MVLAKPVTSQAIAHMLHNHIRNKFLAKTLFKVALLFTVAKNHCTVTTVDNVCHKVVF